MKNFLGKRRIKEEILNFDARRIKPVIIKQVRDLIMKRSKSFNQANISRVSFAAAPLASWVTANLEYADVLQKIKPLEDELIHSTNALSISETQLKEFEESLIQVDEIVSHLKDKFASKTREAKSYKVRRDREKDRLLHAKMLEKQLSGEKDRWENSLKSLRLKMQYLWSDCLLSSAVIVYLGNECGDSRNDYQCKWKNTIMTFSEYSQCDFISIMANTRECYLWKSWGLPNDNTSLENALIVANSIEKKVSKNWCLVD